MEIYHQSGLSTPHTPSVLTPSSGLLSLRPKLPFSLYSIFLSYCSTLHAPSELHYFSHSAVKEEGQQPEKNIICYSVRSNKNVSRPWQKSGFRLHSWAQAVTLSLLIHAHTLSPLTHAHTPTHPHPHERWPCGLCWALWIKKRSHLSDSSSLHLAAPFKNTLYSLLALKLHLTDNMMKSPILPPSFFPPFLLSLSFSLLSLELLLSFHPSCQQSSQESEG